MIYKKLENYSNGENTYIIKDEKTSDAVVIDPGFGGIDISDINIKYILLTHTHYDHISDIVFLRENTDAKIVCSREGSKNLKNKNINLTELGLGYKIEEAADIILSDGEELEFSDIGFKCIYTPGHTSCSCCYLTGDKLYSGDTLFLRSVGRWDLPSGDENTLVNSIKTKLYTLPDEIKVYPGHGDETSIGYEKKYNLFINNR